MEGELVSVEWELGSVEEELEFVLIIERNLRNDGLIIVECYYSRMSYSVKRFLKEFGFEGFGWIQFFFVEVGSSFNIFLFFIVINDEVEYNEGIVGDS